MFKKVIALTLIFAMLVPFSSAAAADATSAPPTVEEILSEYHQKAFEAQTQGETGAASTWSRRGTEKTLEQETVDTLTEAGYEAYNVTADNYDTLEAELQTDFAGMGLNPEGSYIIVVHGEDPAATNSNARTGGDDIVVDDGDLPAGSSHFEYTYNGETYYMRYLTVTAQDILAYGLVDSVDLLDDENNNSIVTNTLNWLIGYGMDEAAPGWYLGTIASILGIELFNTNTASHSTLTQTVGVNWTREFTQVFNFSSADWSSPVSVCYATVWTELYFAYYDSSANSYTSDTATGPLRYLYSDHYNDLTWRKSTAAEKFVSSGSQHEFTGDIAIYCGLEEELTLGDLLIPKLVFDEYPYILIPN